MSTSKHKESVAALKKRKAAEVASHENEKDDNVNPRPLKRQKEDEARLKEAEQEFTRCKEALTRAKAARKAAKDRPLTKNGKALARAQEKVRKMWLSSESTNHALNLAVEARDELRDIVKKETHEEAFIKKIDAWRLAYRAAGIDLAKAESEYESAERKLMEAKAKAIEPLAPELSKDEKSAVRKAALYIFNHIDWRATTADEEDDDPICYESARESLQQLFGDMGVNMTNDEVLPPHPEKKDPSGEDEEDEDEDDSD